jgi:hypothetical protein
MKPQSHNGKFCPLFAKVNRKSVAKGGKRLTNHVLYCKQCQEMSRKDKTVIWSYFFKEHWDNQHKEDWEKRHGPAAALPDKVSSAYDVPVVVSEAEKDHVSKSWKRVAKKCK